MSSELARNAWPLGGYAPGNYTCKCLDCKVEFTGDKRAIQCLECAVVQAKKAYIAVRNDAMAADNTICSQESRIEALEAENARKDAVIVAMKSQLDCALIREGNEKHRAKIAHQNMNAEINARERAEAENARLREDRNRYERKICAAEHGHTINDVLANYRQIRRDIQDRRAREGGNADG